MARTAPAAAPASAFIAVSFTSAPTRELRFFRRFVAVPVRRLGLGFSRDFDFRRVAAWLFRFRGITPPYQCRPDRIEIRLAATGDHVSLSRPQ